MKKTLTLSEKTLIPISFVITIGILIIPIVLNFFQTSDNTARITKNETRIEEIKNITTVIQDDYKTQISNMKEQLNGKLNEIIIMITKITSKLESSSTKKDMTFDP